MDMGVERILSNIIRNSIDAISSRGNILVQTSKENGFVCIMIKDSGKGIPPKDLERIFDPFFSTKNIEQGCGLGLTIVSEIVKHYNGKIEVESTPYKGTAFNIFLPIE